MRTFLRRFYDFSFFSLLFHSILLNIFVLKCVFVYCLQLRLEEERCKEAETRVRELEKQVMDISFLYNIHYLCLSFSLPWKIFSQQQFRCVMYF